jgi:gliding motility-associated-like protein
VNGCTATSAVTTVTVNQLPVVNAGNDETICNGTSATLMATGATTYVWSPVAGLSATTGSTVVATPLATTTYTVTGTDANGCVDTDTVTVNVVNQPIATITPATSVTICEGETTTLTANPGTGFTYVWSTGATTQAIDVSPTTTTNYTVTVSNSTGCSTTSIITTVIVNEALTPIISGVSTVCAGTSTTLTASTSTGTLPLTYLWSTGATTEAITVTPVSNTSYFVTITDANGCSATTAVTTVNVNQLPVVPAITGTTEVCAGSTTVLVNPTSGGVWTTANAAVATIDATGVVSGVAAGSTVITYTVTDVNGCTSNAQALLNVNALPTLAPIGGTMNACIGSSTILTNTTTGGGWTSANVGVATVNSITGAVAGVTAGTATITYTYTNSNGCTNAVSTVVTINSLPVVAPITGTASVCLGSTTPLASNTAGGVWTTANTATATVNAATGLVTGVAAGSTTITYTVTNANGCVSSVSTPLLVNALPVIEAITGSTTVCAGSETIYANATPGGVWTSANNAVASINAAGVVTGGVVGLTTITYTVTNANGCVESVSADIITNPQPVAPVITVTGPTMICPNTTTDLSVPAIFASYQWNNGLTTPSITTGLAGTYFVTVTNSEGCTVNSAPVTITIGDTIAPVITAPADITYNLPSGCSVSGLNIGQPITSDNCSVLNVTNNAPFTFGIGTTQVIWTVYDGLGNSSTAIQTITVVDTVAPQIIAPGAVTVASNINCEASGVFIGTAIGTDNCGFTITNDAPSVFPLGTTTVTWTITDLSGNTVTATQLVTVLDTQAPYVNVVDAKLTLSLQGEAVLDFGLIDVNTSDNCGIDTIIFSQSLFTCSDVGVTPVVVTVIDNSGNISIANIMVTVEASGIDTDFDGIDDSCDDFIDTNAIVIPSGFSPNKDGYNDVFEILGLDNFAAKNLTVYNRHGGLVYQSLTYDNTWDGSFLNTGEPVPDATYYYILRLDNGQVKAGYVYINRVQ